MKWCIEFRWRLCTGEMVKVAMVQPDLCGHLGDLLQVEPGVVELAKPGRGAPRLPPQLFRRLLGWGVGGEEW